MSIDLSFHGVRAITAEAGHAHSGGRYGNHWLDMKIKCVSGTGRVTEQEIGIFLDGPDAARLADEYAAAINAVFEGRADERKGPVLVATEGERHG